MKGAFGGVGLEQTKKSCVSVSVLHTVATPLTPFPTFYREDFSRPSLFEPGVRLREITCLRALAEFGTSGSKSFASVW